MSKECYLKTSAVDRENNSFYRVRDDGVLTIKLENMSIKKTKQISSSPLDLLPSTKEEFEAARSEVLIHLNNL